MAHPENLRPIQKGQLSKEEAKKRGSKGGKKSGEVRREKKKMRELLELALQVKDPATGLPYDVSVVQALIQKALKGDVNAFVTIRDTLGEKPIDRQEVVMPEVIINDDI